MLTHFKDPNNVNFTLCGKLINSRKVVLQITYNKSCINCNNCRNIIFKNSNIRNSQKFPKDPEIPNIQEVVSAQIYFETKEAAKILGLSTSQIRRLTDLGKLTCSKIKGIRKFTKTDIDNYIEEKEQFLAQNFITFNGRKIKISKKLENIDFLKLGKIRDSILSKEWNITISNIHKIRKQLKIPSYAENIIKPKIKSDLIEYLQNNSQNVCIADFYRQYSTQINLKLQDLQKIADELGIEIKFKYPNNRNTQLAS